MRRPPFTLEQLRTFVAVAETEHISRAAQSLYLTQAAVTQQVHHFERSLGLQLLERDGRRVRLTDAGRNLAETCRAALRSVEVVEEAAQAMEHVQAGSLHVGASPTCAVYYLPPYLTTFSRLHPGVKLNVTVEPTIELNRRVLIGTLDCALVEGEADPQLKSAQLTHDELVLVVHRDHPLARQRRVSPADLAAHRYIRRGPEFSAELHVRAVIGDAYDRFDALNLGHPEYVHAATLAGLGFAALPRRAVAEELANGTLKRIPVAPMVRAITAVRRTPRGGPALEAFWEMLTGGAAAASAKISADEQRS